MLVASEIPAVFLTVDPIEPYIANWIRDVLFKNLSAKVNTYENRPMLEDASISLASDHSVVDNLLALGHSPILLLALKRFPKQIMNLYITPLNQRTLIPRQQLKRRVSPILRTRRKKLGLISGGRAFFDSAAVS